LFWFVKCLGAGAQGIVFFAHFERTPKFPGFQSGIFYARNLKIRRGHNRGF